MPTYVWGCVCCEPRKMTEVIRRMDDSDVPPNIEGHTWKRVFTVPQMMVPGGRSEVAYKTWPLKITKAETNAYVDPKTGKAVIKQEDKIFNSEPEYREWLDRNGKCLLADLKDYSNDKGSQHSVFDRPKIDIAPEGVVGDVEVRNVDQEESKYLVEDSPPTRKEKDLALDLIDESGLSSSEVSLASEGLTNG